jgi:3-dehydroquinate synthase
MANGERFKNIRSLERILKFMISERLERNDVVMALGGGVVGDVAGFASAIYMRGLSLVQVPTTLLAQIDSSVGGKTGINLREGKNLVGAFHQPSSVLIDTRTLMTLPRRELVSGFCEAVKQGAVAGRKLFEQTGKLLVAYKSDRSSLLSKEMELLISAQCSFKASIVMNDEREATGRSDSRSRRILNFGHTTGHALEAVTSYRRFRHGEAVGHGMLVAGEISKGLGLLDASELESLREAVDLCGRLPEAEDLDEKAIAQAITRDKKSDAGQIQWVMLEGIGRPRIVDGKEISSHLLRSSLRKALRRQRN